MLSVAASLGFEDLASALRQPHSPMDWRPATLRSGLSCFSLCRHGANSSSVGRRSYCHDAAGIALPLESRTVVSDENRLQKGIAVQTEIFGEQITRMHQTTPAERRSLMIDDLSGWCFGDFYTRKGLTIAERELATFCTIAALGGCEAQLSAHAAANLRCGNTKDNLIDALQCAVVYLGFPRTLECLCSG